MTKKKHRGGGDGDGAIRECYRRTEALVLEPVSAAERRAKLSQHFIHVPPHVRTRRLPYITSSLLERSEAKCCVYECYSPFPTNCD